MPIIIPAHLNEDTLAGGWEISDPLEKLKDKYGRGQDGTYLSLAFDSYIAGGLARAGWSTQIDAADLCATHLMHSNINGADIDSLLARRDSIHAALAEIPLNANLEVELDEGAWAAITRQLAAMECPGIGLAKMTKVLCLKRPALFPMLDSYVMAMLFRDAWPAGMEHDTYADSGVVALKQFQQLLIHDGNLEVLQSVRDEFNAWLSGHAEDRQITPTPVLTTVRVLDNLLWFDSAGYKSFGWTWDEAENRLVPPA